MNADMRDGRSMPPPRDGAPPTSPDPGARFRVTPQVVLGGLIVLFGGILMADNLGVTEARNILRFWPVGLVIVGAMKLFSGVGRSGRVGGGLLLVVGLGLTAEHVLGFPISFDDWWPVVLIAFGLLVILRGRPMGPEGIAATEDQRFSEFATWAGKQRRVATPNFRHADLTAIMGGIEVDFRGAATATGEAVVDVFVMWGGIEIWVPPDWAVSNEVSPLMGGVEDRSTGAQGATHRLTVRGFVLMGGLEIKT
jgi:predicted membrane protein